MQTGCSAKPSIVRHGTARTRAAKGTAHADMSPISP